MEWATGTGLVEVDGSADCVADALLLVSPVLVVESVDDELVDLDDVDDVVDVSCVGV